MSALGLFNAGTEEEEEVTWEWVAVGFDMPVVLCVFPPIALGPPHDFKWILRLSGKKVRPQFWQGYNDFSLNCLKASSL